MAIAAIDMEAGVLRFAGVGNITAMVYSRGGTHHLLSTEGIVGYQMRTPRETQRPWSPGDSLVMASDGLSARWNIARYPGLLQHRPELLASVLFRDFARTNDDATVLVAKDPR